MSNYVLVDGILQKSSPETARWVKRAAKGIPRDTEERDAVALFQVDRETEALDESPEI